MAARRTGKPFSRAIFLDLSGRHAGRWRPSRRWLPAALAPMPIALNLAVILPLYVPRAIPAADGPPLRIASINVYPAIAGTPTF